MDCLTPEVMDIGMLSKFYPPGCQPDRRVFVFAARE
jgi:hypothetical protein